MSNTSKVILFSVNLIFLVFCYAQIPDTLWTRTYGGVGDERSWGRAAQQTTDGGYVIFGQSNSFSGGDYDFYMVKTNPFGDTLWTKVYGGIGDEFCYAGQQTSDGGYILAGMTNAFGADNFDIYLVKTDSLGDIMWTKMIGDSVGIESASGIEQTSDGGYILAGMTNAFGADSFDIYLVKTDSLGDTMWTKTFGGIDNDQAYEVSTTSDGGYIIAAWTRSFGAGNYDAYIIKTDSLGDTLWTFVYGGPLMDKACDVIETSDHYYLVVGWTYSYGAGCDDILILKLNTNGDTLWTKLYGGPSYDIAYSIQETIDCNYIIAGGLSLLPSNLDLCLWKINTDGDSLWVLTCGGSHDDIGFTVKHTSDQGYMVAGFTNSFGSGNYDFYLMKTGPEQSIDDAAIKSVQQINIAATIISGAIILPRDKKCRIFDITGRTIRPLNISPGIYFLEMDGKIAKKIIKVR
ncbi:MAG TPA: hypothetical protein VF399_01805 [bacterium]